MFSFLSFVNNHRLLVHLCPLLKHAGKSLNCRFLVIICVPRAISVDVKVASLFRVAAAIVASPWLCCTTPALASTLPRVCNGNTTVHALMSTVAMRNST